MRNQAGRALPHRPDAVLLFAILAALARVRCVGGINAPTAPRLTGASDRDQTYPDKARFVVQQLLGPLTLWFGAGRDLETLALMEGFDPDEKRR